MSMTVSKEVAGKTVKEVREYRFDDSLTTLSILFEDGTILEWKIEAKTISSLSLE